MTSDANAAIGQGPVLVRGLGDVASAVAHRLFREGLAVALHNGPDPPKTHRRAMSFADAYFDTTATLDGIAARRLDDTWQLPEALRDHMAIPVLVAHFEACLAALHWSLLVDAGLRKRAEPERQRGSAPLVIGLGPGFVAGLNCDMAIETSWGPRLGTIIHEGPTLPFTGEPRAIAGVGRERIVYASVAGTFRATSAIGASVAAGEILGAIEGHPIAAPISGTIRGLVRGGIAVTAGDKLVEIDPRDAALANFSGLGERPGRLADAVVEAIRLWRAAQTTGDERGAAGPSPDVRSQT